MHLPNEIINYVLLPILIFCSRICDVSLSTIRNLFMHKGFRNIVPIIGFFEVLIWLVAMKQVMNRADNIFCYLGWAGGFATGTYVGMRIEERLALGMQVVRIITGETSEGLIQALRDSNHGMTIVDAEGAKGHVKMIFSIVQRKHLKELISIIEKHQPSAFYSIEDVRNAHHGVFQPGARRMSFVKQIFSFRKGK